MVEIVSAATHRHGSAQTFMNKPEISIIVPIYNVGEPLLRPCIESALAQTFRNFELILVDDASTDNSAAVCSEYAATDFRVRFIRLETNGGVSNARNIGVQSSAGTYISFLDSDDCLMPNAIKRLWETAISAKADIVASSFVESKGKTDVSTKDIKIFSPADAVADVLYQRTLDNSPWAKLIRRDICLKCPFLPGRYEDLRTVPHMLLAAERIAYVPERLYVYTANPNSYLHTFNLGRAVVLDVTDELVEFMEKNHAELVPAARDRALSAAFNILNLLTVNKVSAPDIEERCKATIKRYRRESLFNPRVRAKNKTGVLLTYIGGFRALKAVTRIFPPK